MFDPLDSAYAVNLTYYRHMHIYISREISIEHPSVGLASLTQLFVKNPDKDSRELQKLNNKESKGKQKEMKRTERAKENVTGEETEV